MAGEGISRRAALGASAAALAAASAPAVARAKGAMPPGDLGDGGRPTPLPDLARIAREAGRGDPSCLVDLAALDANLATVAGICAVRGWALRPALKTLPAAALAGYVLDRLPEPLGLVFRLDTVAALARASSRPLDLLCGYPPTLGELGDWLGTRPPRRARVTLLSDSVEHLGALAAMARVSPHPRPLPVALELDVGHGRGGMNNRDEIAACAAVLRGERGLLSLTGVLGYDAHARLAGEAPYRRLVARQASGRYWELLELLAAEAGDLHDPATLVRNGPGSANFRNWAAGGPVNEVSPGSALLRAGYLDGGYEVEGLVPAVFTTAPVQRVTSDSPSVPVSQTTLPGARSEEVLFKFPLAIDAMVHPAGGRVDELSGAGNAWVVPKGSLKIGDHALFRPAEADSAGAFGSVIAVREGRVVARWRTHPRLGTR